MNHEKLRQHLSYMLEEMRKRVPADDIDLDIDEIMRDTVFYWFMKYKNGASLVLCNKQWCHVLSVHGKHISFARAQTIDTGTEEERRTTSMGVVT